MASFLKYATVRHCRTTRWLFQNRVGFGIPTYQPEWKQLIQNYTKCTKRREAGLYADRVWHHSQQQEVGIISVAAWYGSSGAMLVLRNPRGVPLHSKFMAPETFASIIWWQTTGALRVQVRTGSHAEPKDSKHLESASQVSQKVSHDPLGGRK